MSEEQLKAAEAEATEEQEEVSGEEISEDDLEGVNGGIGLGMPGEKMIWCNGARYLMGATCQPASSQPALPMYLVSPCFHRGFLILQSSLST